MLNRRGRVAAVVATYNRKESLGRCLDALLGQTIAIDCIYIIDNASSDGTADYLVEKGYVDARVPRRDGSVELVKSIAMRSRSDCSSVIRYVRMAENTGGAGAFHEGLKRGYEAGYDWLWVLDDDGLPDSDALEKLLAAAGTTDGYAFNSLTIAIDRQNLAIGFTMYRGDTRKDGCRTIRNLSEIENDSVVLNGQANFFNGSLIHRDVIKKVGLPNKDFFIWGDEVEYTLRIQDAGFKTYTVRNSFLVHPCHKARELHVLGRTMRFTPLPPWKLYYAVRNSLYIDRKYKLSKYPNVRFVCKFLKNLAVALVLGKDKIKAVCCLAMAFRDGLLGRMYVNRGVM